MSRRRLPATGRNKFTAVVLLSAASLFAVATGARIVTPPPATPAAPEEQGAEEVEVVTATPQGFTPAEITRPHAPFVLAVHNNSGADELSLKLDRVHGEKVSEVRIKPEGHGRAHQRLHLPPGEYVLTEAGNPDWSCRLTITGNE